jgi:hypothetical protein
MALRDLPYLPLYVQDLLTDEKLAECNAEAHGVYLRLMCLMHKNEAYGKILLDEKYQHAGANKYENFAAKLQKHFPWPAEIIAAGLKELASERVITVTENTISQKRMVRDNELSEIRAAAGLKGAQAKNFATANQPAKRQQNAKTGKKANTFTEQTHGPNAEKNADFATAKQLANTETETENEVENASVKKSGAAKIVAVQLPWDTPEFIAAWELWRQYKRQQHRFSYKPIGEQAALKDLAKMAAGDETTAIELIYYAMAKGWKGIYRNQSFENDKRRTGATGEQLASLLAAKLGIKAK